MTVKDLVRYYIEYSNNEMYNDLDAMQLLTDEQVQISYVLLGNFCGWVKGKEIVKKKRNVFRRILAKFRR